MPKPTDIRPTDVTLYLIPIQTRMPLKFGTEVTTEVTCARVRMGVVARDGRRAEGWGETPLSVQWVWPSSKSYQERHEILVDFCRVLAGLWATTPPPAGHPMEVGHAFNEHWLPGVLERYNAMVLEGAEPVPHLAALVCESAFDLALHDAFGNLVGKPIYDTYHEGFMNADLAHFLSPAEGADVDFRGKYPEDFLVPPPASLPAWHLVGGKDPIEPSELQGDEPDDGYPVLLRDWIERDRLDCLKIKLRGDDSAWDYERLCKVGRLAIDRGANWLTADFNCTVREPAYVNELLDRLLVEHPRIYGMILYVEQPFPYDLEAHRIDVRSVSARKPLFMDESAHDWRFVRLGRSLGWSGVALKTCKTQTGALLSQAWAKAHGMTLMVQDLTNPMLAQISHVQLAAQAGTIMGVETNGMQFYPEASLPEAAVHPGLYRRKHGRVDLSTIRGPGFGYRVDEIERTLPEPFLECRP
ncbi:MAG: enolase C-terminal domain-like protein [Isosphaeraceae bacterium]|nr:enolase C-terminal domain-like protein [Isosphaeraceae bacterium]